MSCGITQTTGVIEASEPGKLCDAHDVVSEVVQFVCDDEREVLVEEKLHPALR